MTKLLEKAFQNVLNLTAVEQDQLGRRLLTWYEMRQAIDAALVQADQGEFSMLDADTIIAHARAVHVTK